MVEGLYFNHTHLFMFKVNIQTFHLILRLNKISQLFNYKFCINLQYNLNF